MNLARYQADRQGQRGTPAESSGNLPSRLDLWIPCLPLMPPNGSLLGMEGPDLASGLLGASITGIITENDYTVTGSLKGVSEHRCLRE